MRLLVWLGLAIALWALILRQSDHKVKGSLRVLTLNESDSEVLSTVPALECADSVAATDLPSDNVLHDRREVSARSCIHLQLFVSGGTLVLVVPSRSSTLTRTQAGMKNITRKASVCVQVPEAGERLRARSCAYKDSYVCLHVQRVVGDVRPHVRQSS